MCCKVPCLGSLTSSSQLHWPQTWKKFLVVVRVVHFSFFTPSLTGLEMIGSTRILMEGGCDKEHDYRASWLLCCCQWCAGDWLRWLRFPRALARHGENRGWFIARTMLRAPQCCLWLCTELWHQVSRYFPSCRDCPCLCSCVHGYSFKRTSCVLTYCVFFLNVFSWQDLEASCRMCCGASVK